MTDPQIIDKLERLESLKDRGTISQAEFEAQKSQLLGQKSFKSILEDTDVQDSSRRKNSILESNNVRFALFAAACAGIWYFALGGNQSGTSCSSSQVIGLAKRTIKEKIASQDIGSSVMVSLKYKVNLSSPLDFHAVRTTGSSFDKIQKCTAQISNSDKPASDLSVYYTVQATDDNKQIYVNVSFQP